jgi:hypothetical protein
MGSPNTRGQLIARIAHATALIAFALVLPNPAGAQQPCNPVIDGTYCAEQMRGGSGSSRSGVTMNPIQDFGRSISGTPTSPATLGGISVRGGSTCIGLLRRGACN